MIDDIPEIPGTIACPVCQKRILQFGTAFPETYNNYLYQDDDEDTIEVDEDCPVQYGWSSPIPFQVASFGLFVMKLEEEIFPPLTLVCQSHPLKVLKTDEEAQSYVPTLPLIPSETFLLSAAEVHWIQENLKGIQEEGTDLEKILWLWIQIRLREIERAETSEEED